MEDIIFLAVTIFTLAGSTLVAVSRSIINAAFGLLMALSGVAGIYVYLSADFLAVSQVLIYVGGVVVLIMFGIMLTSGNLKVRFSNPGMGAVPAALASLGFLAINFYAIYHGQLLPTAGEYAATTRGIGNLLLMDYVLPFELASFLIVVILVGSAVLIRKELVRRNDESKDASSQQEEQK